jgi:hypothetical protein
MQLRWVLIIFFGWMSFAAPVILAQQPISESQQQLWLADYDTFAQTLLQLNPNIKIKEQLFQYAITDSILKYRNEVTFCSNQSDFIAVLRKASNSTLDGHTAVISSGVQHVVNLRLYLTYIDGNYFTMRAFTFNDKHIPAGSKVVSVNGIPVNEAVQQLVPYRYMMRYDIERKQFYHELFYLSDNYIRDGNITMEFLTENNLQKLSFLMSSEVKFDNEIEFTNGGKQVIYFEDKQLLYIKMPSMQFADKKWYKKEIIKIASGQTINKIIIDVRNNNGGSSLTGRYTMEAIIATPLALPNVVYGNNPDNLSRKYKRLHGINTDASSTMLPFFENVKSYNLRSDTTIIQPAKNGLHFEGPIYIVGNEWIYSAGGAIFNIADISTTDSIYSVGTKTGMMLGEFTDPVMFELPNSKIEFRVAVSFDFTAVHSRKEIFREKYDIFIQPDIQYYTNYYKFKGSMISAQWLFEQDLYIMSILNK